MKGLTLYTEEQAAKTVRSLYDDLSRRILHFPRGNCPVELTGAFLRLCLAQSCGKCVPCREKSQCKGSEEGSHFRHSRLNIFPV